MEDEEGFQEKEEYVEKEIKPIYKGDLGIETMKEKPILKPIAEINKSFVNNQKLLNKSDWNYKQAKKEIDDMLQLMPKYSQTMIVAVMLKLIMYVEHSNFLWRQQQELLKKGMQEMVEIASESLEGDFDIVEKEEEIESEEEQSESEPIPPEQ